MPLREDLLTPIAGDNPSGPDLKYDKIFDQLKEARIEDDESIPTGQWGRAPKKADRVLILKVAGEALVTRTKDLRLLSWYLESLVRREGFSQLVGSIEMLSKMQAEFWDTIHPELDEDGSADLRIGAIESASVMLGEAVKFIPLTRSGFPIWQYKDATSIGFDDDERTYERKAERDDAISRGALTADELQKAVDSTSKAFYVDLYALLSRSLEVLDELNLFHEEKYGDDYPSMSRVQKSIEAVHQIINMILVKKRETEPDVVEAEPEPEEEPQEEYAEPEPSYEMEEAPVARAAAPRKHAPVGVPTDENSAYEQIAAAAEFLRTLNTASPVPYLISAALRLGEARGDGLSDMSFPVAPPTETRQALRRLANESNWEELSQLCLKTMAEPCGRVWLDLQRYAWRAASESWQPAKAQAIVATVRALLTDLPQIRTMMMDDDTPAANAETQQWIDSEILPPAPEPDLTQYSHSEPEPETAYQPPVYAPAEEAAPDIYDLAVDVLKRGRVAEAISMLVRDSEAQPSGRMRFQRRVQMAQLCLMAEQGPVAYPVLRDLSAEMERRQLDTWEAAEMLSLPLSLLLRCLEQRNASEQDKEIIFERLCRLDPQAALTIRR